MKGIIMVAGRGTRLLPVTESISKCLLPVGGKPIMQYSLEHMNRLGVHDVCIVVNRDNKDDVERMFGDTFKNIRITYAVQEDSRKGTAAAVLAAAGFVGGDDVAIVAGDILIDYDDMKALYDFHARNGKGSSVLLKEVDDPKRFGVAVLENGKITDIIEKPKNPKTNLANTSVYVCNKEFFDELENVKLSARGEYEITSALYSMCNKGGLYGVVAKGYWNDVGTPWALLDANEHYMKLCTENDIKGRVENCIIKGKGIVVEEGAEVSDAYLHGPCYISKGAKINSYAQILPHSYIGEECEIGGATIIKNSIILNKCKAKHLSYIGDSIIGERCNFGSSTQIANLRFDRHNVKMRINGNIYDTGRKKMGCVSGSDINFGVNSIVLPGRKVGSGSMIGPGVIVKYDVSSNMRVLQKQELEFSHISK